MDTNNSNGTHAFDAPVRVVDKVKSHASWIQAVVGAVIAIAAAAVYFTSFAKRDDVAKALAETNSKIDIQHDKINELGSRLDVQKAVIDHIDTDLHELLRRTDDQQR